MNDRVRPIWERGRGDELKFWRQVIDGEGTPGKYQEELLERADSDRQFPRWLADYLSGLPLEQVRILDIGAGPISILGWVLDGVRLNITAIDALANEYEKMLNSYGITPPVKTQQCEAEHLCERFHDNYFDLIHCRNALDHCFDPIQIIHNALRLLKPSASMIICSNINEGENGNYRGFHQWNICTDKDEVVIWRPGSEQILSDVVNGSGKVYVISKSLDWGWITFGITKFPSK